MSFFRGHFCRCLRLYSILEAIQCDAAIRQPCIWKFMARNLLLLSTNKVSYYVVLALGLGCENVDMLSSSRFSSFVGDGDFDA